MARDLGAMLPIGADVRAGMLSAFGSSFAAHDRVQVIVQADQTYVVVRSGSREVCEERSSRSGVGHSVAFHRVMESYRSAHIALAYAAGGTAADPGPRCVHADQLGILLDLAPTLVARRAPIADVEAIEDNARRATWVLPTLDAVSRHPSVRDAATALYVHHSTLQTRLAALESGFDWPLQTTLGRHRLYVALCVRRFMRHPPLFGTATYRSRTSR